MKITLMITFMLCFSLKALPNSGAASIRSNGLIRFIASNYGLRDFALFNLIAKRCNRYMPAEADQCKLAVEKQIQVLNFDVIFSDEKKDLRVQDDWAPQSFVFVAFRKNLVEILSLPLTTDYLNELQHRLNRYLVREDSTINIWDLTLSYYKTPWKAAMVIAALFQDTSIMKLHLAYLERTQIRGQKNFEINKEALSKSIDTINLILDYSEASFRDIFYPRSVKGKLNRNIYHFYVPLYLAMELQAQGVSPRFAYASSLMLNLTYEFITASRDYRYIFADPGRIDFSRNYWKLQDIYGGYCGASFGTNVQTPRLSLEELGTSFSRSTFEAVELLLRN